MRLVFLKTLSHPCQLYIFEISLVSIEKRVHPIPFRTRKLSASSPMILRIFTWESRPMPRLSLERLLFRSLSSFKALRAAHPCAACGAFVFLSPMKPVWKSHGRYCRNMSACSGVFLRGKTRWAKGKGRWGRMLRGESVCDLGGRRLRLPEPGGPDTARLCGRGGSSEKRKDNARKVSYFLTGA